MLQEALISKFSKGTLGALNPLGLVKAIEKGKKGQLALLGKLPDFTMGEKFSENK